MSETPSVVAIELNKLRDAMDKRFDALTHEMRNGILTRLDRLEGRFDTLETKVGTLASTVDALGSTVDGMATTLAEVHAAAVPDAK